MENGAGEYGEIGKGSARRERRGECDSVYGGRVGVLLWRQVGKSEEHRGSYEGGSENCRGLCGVLSPICEQCKG